MLSQRLKLLRKETPYTQAEMADKIGVARTTYAMYEQGKREPDNNTLDKIATYFNVSVDYLLGRTNIKYQFNENHQYKDFDDFLNDPVLLDFLQTDLKDATPEEIEKLRAMYKIIKNT